MFLSSAKRATILTTIQCRLYSITQQNTICIENYDRQLVIKLNYTLQLWHIANTDNHGGADNNVLY